MIIDECLSCNEFYSKKLNEKLKKKFKNTFPFSNNDINKFILLLRKGVYPFEYKEYWEKFNETKFLEKEEFYSNLKSRKYYRCRLHAFKKSLQRL